MAGRRTQAGRVLQSTGWRCDLLPVPARLPVPLRAAGLTQPQRTTCLTELCTGSLLQASPYPTLPERRTPQQSQARQSKGSPPQGADERLLLSKFTISSCALMLWDKAVTLQYKTTWKHSATALSFPVLELCSCKQHRPWDNLASLSAALSLYKSDAQSAYG